MREPVTCYLLPTILYIPPLPDEPLQLGNPLKCRIPYSICRLFTFELKTSSLYTYIHATKLI